MTAIVGIHLPGLGAVIGGDGRVTQGDHIVTDGDRKVVRAGEVIVGGCGALPHWRQVTRARTWARVRKLSPATELEWELLAYDKTQDRLLALDNEGIEMVMTTHYAIGAGGAYALGALDAYPPPTTLATAQKLVVDALRIACKRSTLCGGRFTVITSRL